jgi:hypothetical protein
MLKLNLKNFSLKVNFREKKNKCYTVGTLDKFYKSIIEQQKSKLDNILINIENPNLEFLLRAYNINSHIYKDNDLHELISNKIHETEIQNETSKNKNTMYNLYKTIAEKYTNDPTSSLAKDLLLSIVKKSYLFTKPELNDLLEILKVTEKEAKEIEENVFTSNKKYLDRFKLRNQSFEIAFSKSKEKVNIFAKSLNKKIVLYALEESNENVLKALDIVDKEKPNILIFQKRPVFNLLESDSYISVFDKERLMAYYKEILLKDKSFFINNVEKLVYQNVNNIKTISFVQSLMLKCYFSLNMNYDLRVIFSDVPKSQELRFIIEDVMTDKNASSLFFSNFKLNYLFEKYLWFTDDMDKRCFECSSMRHEYSHLNTEDLFEEYLLGLNNNLKVKNISEKILNAAKFFTNEPVILCFVGQSYLYAVLEQITQDLICLDNSTVILDSDYKKLFDHKKTDLSDLYKKTDKKEFLNKLAITNNIYPTVS